LGGGKNGVACTLRVDLRSDFGSPEKNHSGKEQWRLMTEAHGSAAPNDSANKGRRIESMRPWGERTRVDLGGPGGKVLPPGEDVLGGREDGGVGGRKVKAVRLRKREPAIDFREGNKKRLTRWEEGRIFSIRS